MRSGIGINRTISISNTRKMTANRKNRIENGIRAECNGSNPHSNGDDFSRFIIERDEMIHAIANTIGGNSKAINVAVRDMIMRYWDLFHV